MRNNYESPMFSITEHVAKHDGHATFYLACGAADAPPIIFVHGWPDLSIGWRHQLPAFAALGFRAIAPDMRGYGRSTVYMRHEDYAVQHAVSDMLALLQSLGRDKALWVGHDWGSPVVWSLAGQHPERCVGIASLCVPYLPEGFAPQTLIPLVDRTVYPQDQLFAGQWDYQLLHEENFDRARSCFEADVSATVRALFRHGDPAGVGKPAPSAFTRKTGDFFGGAGRAPDVPLDTSVLTDVDCCAYVAALERTGFFGPDSWYRNAASNMEYAKQARDGGRLSLPALFLHATYDFICETTANSHFVDPMRKACSNLTEVHVKSGHWMAQEQPVAVNRALARFIGEKLPQFFSCQALVAER
uniref:Epoxide hydrolase n=1 Tax=uncultured organism TaxID=155900 RepID=C3V8M7_9ZZZZ|nr:epoxide hydrolase [uncultured organism]